VARRLPLGPARRREEQQKQPLRVTPKVETRTDVECPAIPAVVARADSRSRDRPRGLRFVAGVLADDPGRGPLTCKRGST
jgi:hypothetical protein